MSMQAPVLHNVKHAATCNNVCVRYGSMAQQIHARRHDTCSCSNANGFFSAQVRMPPLLSHIMLSVVCCTPNRDTLLHGQPMRRPSIKSMDIPHGMREVVEQECNASQVRTRRDVSCGALAGAALGNVACHHGLHCADRSDSGCAFEFKHCCLAICHGSALSVPQMGALRAGLDGTPLVLIQGPPGTGKSPVNNNQHACTLLL